VRESERERARVRESARECEGTPERESESVGEKVRKRDRETESGRERETERLALIFASHPLKRAVRLFRNPKFLTPGPTP